MKKKVLQFKVVEHRFCACPVAFTGNARQCAHKPSLSVLFFFANDTLCSRSFARMV